MGTRAILAALAALILAFSGCNIQEKIERAVEDQVSSAISNALEEGGFPVREEGVPEGYPLEEFPVYGGSSSVVMGGSRQTLEGTLMYNLVIGTDDAPDVVEAAIREDYESRSSEFEELTGSGFYMGVIGDWDYSIVINDGQADGFASVVSYMLQGE